MEVDRFIGPPWLLSFELGFGARIGLVSIVSALNTYLEDKNQGFSLSWWEIYGWCRLDIDKSTSFISQGLKRLGKYQDFSVVLSY